MISIRKKNGAWLSLDPTYDLYLNYSPQDTIRRKASFMMNGDFYPELNAAGGGYKAGGQSMKKHIIGNEKDNNSPSMTLQHLLSMTRCFALPMSIWYMQKRFWGIMQVPPMARL
jgi:hypothetical protein